MSDITTKTTKGTIKKTTKATKKTNKPKTPYYGDSKASDYTQLTPEEHVLHRPDTYIGSIDHNNRQARVLITHLDDKHASNNGEDTPYYQTEDGYFQVDNGFVGQDADNNPLPDTPHPFFGRRMVSVPSGMIRLYLEVLINAGDNADRSRNQGVDIGKVNVSMNNKTVTIRNNGVPIPVEIHPEWDE